MLDTDIDNFVPATPLLLLLIIFAFAFAFAAFNVASSSSSPALMLLLLREVNEVDLESLELRGLVLFCGGDFLGVLIA